MTDILESANISTKNEWDETVLSFLNSRDLQVSSIYGRKIASYCYAFIEQIKEVGVNTIKNISYISLDTFVSKEAKNGKRRHRSFYSTVSALLSYMGDMGLCGKSIAWYYDFRRTGKIVSLSSFSKEQIELIENKRSQGKCFSEMEFRQLLTGFKCCIQKYQYHMKTLYIAEHGLIALYLFLDRNDIKYNPEIVNIWFEESKGILFYTNWREYRRIFVWLERYIRYEDIQPSIVSHYKSTNYEQLPLWCKNEIECFLSNKRKEGLKYNSIKIFKSALTKFCHFLVNEGMVSFTPLSASIIKKFNQADIHTSAKGKNQYNSKIRAFLKYLERESLVSNMKLHDALFCTSAQCENIVTTLTEEERQEIKERHQKASTAIELRDRAMMLLGTEMGLRGIDVVELRISDVDLHKQTIRIMQSKTSKEIERPMPVNVGNAIYTYAKFGRHETKSEYLFIKTCAPYDKVTTSTCNKALNRTLPNRNVPGSGFHVGRRTFATDSIRKGITPSVIADLVGSQDITALKPYLSLDEERMRLCALSLAEQHIVPRKEK